MQLLKAQRSEQWLEARRGKVTASLAAAILGIDPYTGPLSAFNQITGKTKKASNYWMERGMDAEPLAVHAYEVMSGNLAAPGGFWVHDKFLWLGASPDGIIAHDGLLECKAPAEVPADIPEHHEIQCRVQMAVCDRSWVDYFSWHHEHFLLVRVERDQAREESLLFRLCEFYEKHILLGIPPPRRRVPLRKEALDEEE